MRKFVQMVLTDEGFRVLSVSAKDAVKTAEQLLEWSSQPENNNVFEPFSCELVEELDCCFRVDCRNLQSRQELMWKNLFKLGSSPCFRSKWSGFLSSSSGVSASPIFYQFVVDSVFNSLLKQHHQIDMPEERGMEASLSYEEKNALRYSAGYVTRALKNKFKCSSLEKQVQVLE